MKKKIILYKIREEKLDTWNAWARELDTALRDQALKTLEEEGVCLEFSASFPLAGATYVVGYMEGAMLLPANMEEEINRRHRQMKEDCLERVTEGTFLYHLRQINGGSHHSGGRSGIKNLYSRHP